MSSLVPNGHSDSIPICSTGGIILADDLFVIVNPY